MHPGTQGLLAFDRFVLDLERGSLRDGDRDIELPPKPFEVLRHLVVNAGRLVSKQELFAVVWPNVAVSDDSLVQCIRELRRKLGDDERRLIKTVSRRGYLLDTIVAQLAPQALDSLAGEPPEELRSAAPSSAGPVPWQISNGGVAQRAHVSNPEPLAHAGDAVASTLYRGVRGYMLGFLVQTPLVKTLTLLVAFSALLAALALGGASRSELEKSALLGRSTESPTPHRSFHIALAVPPFATSIGDHESRHPLAERLDDELRSNLSRNSFMRVLSRETAHEIETASVDRHATRSKPGVRYVLNGSVQTQDEKLRLTVDLIDVSTRVQVWSKQIEHPLAEWPARQTDVARQLAYAVHVETMRREGIDLPDSPSALSDAQLLGSGWASLTGWGALRLKHAALVFSEALRRDPTCTSAMVGLAGTKLLVASNLMGERPRYMAEAEALLRNALIRRNTDFITYFYLGVLHNLESNVPAALQAYDRALEMNPSFAPAYAYRGRALIRMARYGEALESIEYAYRVAGKVVSGWQLWQGIAQLGLDRDHSAGESFRRALAALPENPYVHAALAGFYALHEDLQGAQFHIDKLRKRTPEMSDQMRLVEFNKGEGNQPLPGRLSDGLRRALEAHPEIR